MNAKQRALRKTIITVALIALIITICMTWPFITGYIVLAAMLSVIVMFIYAAWGMYEEGKDSKPWK